MNNRIYIVCTGVSLTGFDFNILKGQRVLAVNYAYKYLPDFEAVVALDWGFYVNELESLRKLNRIGYAVRGYVQEHMPTETGLFKIEYLNPTGADGIDYLKGNIRHSFNSGYTALGIAVQLGAKDIRLLGMDLSETRKHFYDTVNDYDYILPSLEKFKRDLREDIVVTNYSINSRIECFQKKDLSEVLNDL